MCKILLIWLCFFFGFVLQAFSANVQQPTPIRAVHFVLRSVGDDEAKRMADLASKSGFNTLIFELGDAVQFSSFPGHFFANALPKDNLLQFVQYARDLGLYVVPEINLLTHQQKLFGKSRPDLMFNSLTYDPRKPEIYKIVFAYLTEIISLIHPSAILIGHDEVARYNGFFRKKWLNVNEKMLPADLFLHDVNQLHKYLNQKNIQTWMWGDMLISPYEYPDMPLSGLNGTPQGYGRELRKKLSKDIVICDWHYFGEQAKFPTLDAFKEEGFRVLGATWKDTKTIHNFSRYAATHRADGMIATTWFYVQRKDWDVVDRIIFESGDAFRKDFPDAK